MAVYTIPRSASPLDPLGAAPERPVVSALFTDLAASARAMQAAIGSRKYFFWPVPRYAPTAEIQANSTETIFKGDAASLDWQLPWFVQNGFGVIRVRMTVGVAASAYKAGTVERTRGRRHLEARVKTSTLVTSVATTSGTYVTGPVVGTPPGIWANSGWASYGFQMSIAPTLPADRRVLLTPYIRTGAFNELFTSSYSVLAKIQSLAIEDVLTIAEPD